MRRSVRLAALLAAAAGLAGAAEAPRPRVLERIQPGQWVLRGLDGSTPTRSICLTDPAVLLQLNHPEIACTRIVLEDGATSGKVHYSCAGRGHGDTMIRVETSTLIDIVSQGIVDNAPFNMSIEGRRVGACAPRLRTGRRPDRR